MKIEALKDFCKNYNLILFNFLKSDDGIDYEPSSLGVATERSISFLVSRAGHCISYLYGRNIGVLIIDRYLFDKYENILKYLCCYVIISNNAYKTFMTLVQKKWHDTQHLKYIHCSAVIAPDAIIGRDCTIGSNVVIRERCIIGNNVCIQPNTTIGNEGFGFLREEDSSLIRFPHIGKVIIEDDVEIGSSVCIDKAALHETRICKGVKIDNLCHIAHNVYIGKNTGLAAGCVIGGSVEIGENCWIAPHSVIRDNLKIGNDVLIGVGSVVTKDIQSNVSVYGCPASIKETSFHMVHQE